MFKRESKIFILCILKRECLPQHLPYGLVHPRYPRGSDFVLFIQPRSGRSSSSLSKPVLVDLRSPYPTPFFSVDQPYNINKVVLEIRLVTCCETFHISQISASVPNPIFIVMINIWPFEVIFGCYGTLSDDSDSAQVRFLRHPQQEGQRGRCPAKHTKS